MKHNEIPNSSYQYYKQFAQDLKPMSPEEEAYICKRIANGDEAAREMLVFGYIYLAEKLALDKVTQLNAYSMSDDLIQSAIHGLSKAATSFDATKDTRFYSYAMSAINNSIQDELMGANVVTMNTKFYHNVYVQVQNFCSQYAAEHEGQLPVMREVCDALNITPAQYQAAQDAAAINNTAYSLDERVKQADSDDKPMSVGDKVADPDSTNFTEELETKDVIRDALSCLAERDREIITLRFGLNGGKEMSRNELANLFGTTPNNISKRITASLTKMQKHLTREERNSCDER